MSNHQQQLLRLLRDAKGKLVSLGELMARAKINPGERTNVKRELRDLVRDGLARKEGKRYALAGTQEPHRPPHPGPPPRGGRGTNAPALGRARGHGVLGTLKRHRDGFGFVARVDRKGEDIYVPEREAARAMDGDLVRVEEEPGTRGRTQGRILEVVERRRRYLVGTYEARGHASFVVPADPQLEGYVPVPETSLAEDGEVVKVALEPGQPLHGVIVEKIGQPGSPRVEVLKVAYAAGFSDLFPVEVSAAAGHVPDHVLAEEKQGRRDLTRTRLVTIDGADARDFDDAVYVEREGDGYRLVVAIADVAHYVREGAPLDEEALRRGTSVYFPQQVLPMLPERLSNGICSLNPGVERLCMVADMRLDARGEPRGAELYEAVMKSAARCTYDEVWEVLRGGKVPHREFLRADFELMGELQEKLTAMRERRGAIDFDLPEAKIVLGDDGEVKGLEKRPRNRAHRLVEEFMLAANEAVARHFTRAERPTVYRVHGEPDEEKLQKFLDLAAMHGFVPRQGALDPKALNALLKELEGHPQARALNQLLLRAMMQAIYSPENIGHYGLAAEHYLHFTSPIRRYPDLMVHRLLKKEWAGEKPASEQRLGEIAQLASERERAAMQAEREIMGFYAARFMQDKVGQRFGGVVASVVEFGLFVELKDVFVEGLVKVEDLGYDWSLDVAQHALVERSTGRAFRVGDEVEVEVTNASPARRQIDLALVEGGVARRGGVEPGRPAGKRGKRLAEAVREQLRPGKMPFAAGGKPQRGGRGEQKQRGRGQPKQRGGPPHRGGGKPGPGKHGGGRRGGRGGRGRR